MGGVRGRSDEFLNEFSVLAALVAAPPLVLLFFLSAALDIVSLCVFAGAGALAGFLSPAMTRRTLKASAAFSCWLALVVGWLWLVQSSWS